MAIQHRTKTERVYVKVDSTFDASGYMQPTAITWADGRTFPIEKVRDFRPAGTADNGCSGDCFTVLIKVTRNICSLNTSTHASLGDSAGGLWKKLGNKFIRRKGFINDYL